MPIRYLINTIILSTYLCKTEDSLTKDKVKNAAIFGIDGGSNLVFVL